MATDPIFAATPKAAQTQIATANTARDGSGTIGTLLTSGASGSRIEEIHIVGVGTVTGGMVRLFSSFDSGTTKRLLRERPVTATTPSATAAGWLDIITFANLVLPTGSQIYAATHNAETFNVFAFYEDF